MTPAGGRRRLDALERVLGGANPGREFCGPWGHRCDDPAAPHREFTLRIGDRAEDQDGARREPWAG